MKLKIILIYQNYKKYSNIKILNNQNMVTDSSFNDFSELIYSNVYLVYPFDVLCLCGALVIVSDFFSYKWLYAPVLFYILYQC